MSLHWDKAANKRTCHVCNRSIPGGTQHLNDSHTEFGHARRKNICQICAKDILSMEVIRIKHFITLNKRQVKQDYCCKENWKAEHKKCKDCPKLLDCMLTVKQGG